MRASYGRKKEMKQAAPKLIRRVARTGPGSLRAAIVQAIIWFAVLP